jgi:hypothetical protein
MSIFEKIRKNESYRKVLIETLCAGIPGHHQTTFIQTLDWVIENKYEQIEKLEGKMYEDEDSIQELILPSVRRLYGKMFVSPPSLLTGDNEISQNKYKLFVLLFDLEEFCDYLVEMIELNRGTLKSFKYLDKTSETLSLIVDNYIANLIQRVKDCDDLEIEIKKLERNSKIKNILND